MISSNSFFIGNTAMTFNKSISYCKSLNANLASIHSQSDFNQTRELCKPTGLNGCWIGLNDINKEEKWNWTDGSPIDYGFIGNEPSYTRPPWRDENEPNGGTSENCIEIDGYNNFYWNDIRCDDNNYPICKIITQSGIA